jgi:hypothetical protein
MSIVKLNNKAVSNATAFGSITSLGSMTFIKKLTASSSATLSFVDGSDGVVLDDTYKEYVFTFKNIHPANDNVFLGQFKQMYLAEVLMLKLALILCFIQDMRKVIVQQI